MKPELLNGANLAFIGDAFYELFIRKYLLNQNITSQNDLHRQCVKYVSAEGHNRIVAELEKTFTEEELVIFKRGRNHKYTISRKNLKKSEYLNSSGFEAVLGYLYLRGNIARAEEIATQAIAVIEEKNE